MYANTGSRYSFNAVFAVETMEPHSASGFAPISRKLLNTKGCAAGFVSWATLYEGYSACKSSCVKGLDVSTHLLTESQWPFTYSPFSLSQYSIHMPFSGTCSYVSANALQVSTKPTVDSCSSSTMTGLPSSPMTTFPSSSFFSTSTSSVMVLAFKKFATVPNVGFSGYLSGSA